MAKARATRSIKLARKTASALIVDSLRERLMNHEFSESEMIRQERLAREYNVSPCRSQARCIRYCFGNANT